MSVCDMKEKNKSFLKSEISKISVSKNDSNKQTTTKVHSSIDLINPEQTQR